MSGLKNVKKHLRPGRIYRRAELTRWSCAVDRHLQQLQEEGSLTKLSGGLYYCPRKTTFGTAPADDKTLVKAFLKDGRFLITSPNAYNALGVGTTQLYNTTIVYNRKRHGRFDLGGRVFTFRMKPYFPLHLTPEFLLIDLVNNLKELAEDHDRVLGEVRKKAASMDTRALSKTVKQYGSLATRKFFAKALSDDGLTNAVR